MTLAAVCASHTPLMGGMPIEPGIREAVEAGFERLRAAVDAFRPDCIIQFAPDHFNGFFYDLMPSFCVGVEAASIGDWDTRAAPLPVPSDTALAVVEAAREADIDVAVSHRMMVDHGFVQIWEVMYGHADSYPIIPIFVNCAAPPLPSYRRARLLGEAIGRFAVRSGQRVLFAASGGLSHDPPVPDLRTAPRQVRERLINGRNPTPEAVAARQQSVFQLGELAGRGEGPCKPLNPQWDRAFIARLLSGELQSLDTMSTDEVREAAGRGGNESLCWVAAFAALAAAGPYEATLEFYQPIHAWIAGMAMMTASSAAYTD